MANRTEARPAKAAPTNATGRLPLLRLFSTPLIVDIRRKRHSRRQQCSSSRWLFVFVSAGVGNALHFQMKLRLRAAGFPVVWFMMPWDDFRMWRTYRREAPSRNWPVWPFYAYRVIGAVFVISSVVVFLNVDKFLALTFAITSHASPGFDNHPHCFRCSHQKMNAVVGPYVQMS